MRRREEVASQQTAAGPESSQSSTPPLTDDQIMLEAVGPPDAKGRIYGFGSQLVGPDAASSSRGPQYGPHEDAQMRRDYERMQAELLRQANENSSLKQQFQEMQGQFARLEAMMLQQQRGFHAPDQQYQPPPPAPAARAQHGIVIRDGSSPAAQHSSRAAADQDYDEGDFDCLGDLDGTRGPGQD